jgi:hypothetical protein
MGRGANRPIVRAFLAAALTWCAGATAATGTDLYRTKVTVTGQGEANRIVGFAACLEDVLIKASGAQKLSGDRRLATYKSKAKDLVTSFSYRDQFSGKLIHLNLIIATFNLFLEHQNAGAVGFFNISQRRAGLCQ